MRELFCLHRKSWDIPILGVGCPWLGYRLQIFSCALQIWTAAECCFHMEDWEKNGLTLALRERAGKPEMVAQLPAFTGALTSRHGLSLAVKHRSWKKLVKRQALSLHLYEVLAACWEALLPSPKAQTGLQTLCHCWGLCDEAVPCRITATPFRSKNDVFDHHMEKKQKQKQTSEKDCQHLINEVFPCGRICAQFSARDPGNAKNEAWDQHLFQSWEIRIQHTNRASSTDNCQGKLHLPAQLVRQQKLEQRILQGEECLKVLIISSLFHGCGEEACADHLV